MKCFFDLSDKTHFFDFTDKIQDTRKNDSDDISRMFLVRRNHFDPISQGNPLPYFDRTRSITVYEQYIRGSPQVCIQCDCHYFMRRGHACRHIYCALKIKPTPDHVFPEGLKSYETHMMTNSPFTTKCIAKKELLLSKGCLVIEGTLDDVCRDAVDSELYNLDWYMEARGKVIDVNKNVEIPNCDTR